MEKPNRETVFGTAGLIVGLLIGAISILALNSRFQSAVSIPKSHVAACAIGQDEALRNTSGRATFLVYFEDGEYTKMKCEERLIRGLDGSSDY